MYSIEHTFTHVNGDNLNSSTTHYVGSGFLEGENIICQHAYINANYLTSSDPTEMGEEYSITFVNENWNPF